MKSKEKFQWFLKRAALYTIVIYLVNAFVGEEPFTAERFILPILLALVITYWDVVFKLKKKG